MRRSLERLNETKMSTALQEYRVHLVTNRRNKPRSADDTIYRLRSFFTSPEARLRNVTPAKCRALYDDLATRPRLVRIKGGRTKPGAPLGVDSRLDVLMSVNTFLRWCVGKAYLPANPAAGITDDGQRNHGGIGQTCLSTKELRRLYVRCLDLAREGDERALGVLLALVLGMRSSEITTLQARFVDDVKWVLEIPIESAKTRASHRKVAVPEVLRPLLAARLQGRSGERYVFGDGEVAHDRGWVTDTLKGLCKALRFPRVETAHGLRGAHNDLAKEAGQTGEAVAAQLGHERPSTADRSYTSEIGRRAGAGGKQRAVLGVLEGGRE